MNYETVELPVELETAERRISERVSGVKVRRSSDSVEYHTPSGVHLATLSRIRSGTGDEQVRVRYRTAIISAPVAHARRKATEIRSAVKDLEP
jgi:hypothetical protein